MAKKVAILGMDGYIGWPLTLHLLDKGYKVCGIDDLSRRQYVQQVGSKSLTPILTANRRFGFLRDYDNFLDAPACINTTNYPNLKRFISYHKPDTIVHLAEQPSAPFSMKDTRSSMSTQISNVLGTLSLLWIMKEECPQAHLIKIGTMGEYGTPNCNIPEGIIPNKPCDWTVDISESMLSKKCPMSGLLFPRSPWSFYHASKVHSTYNIQFACQNWGLTATDIMQGILFGVWGDLKHPTSLTRFDYDQYFGTVVNRFCAQLISGNSLTVYGEGKQVRSFLPLEDAIKCLRLAIDNPPKPGTYRTYNQFDNICKIKDMAVTVHKVAKKLGIQADIELIDNPRNEREDHYYFPERQELIKLGYIPGAHVPEEIEKLILTIKPLKDRVDKKVLYPTTKWR
jgi:UDP-sulfoquinovose synthase